jgi:hypothetical protein
MRKTFIEMGLNLEDLTLVHDTYHGIIPGQSSSPNRRIDLEVACGSGDNKHREMLMFEVASFDIEYNCILGRSFLLKFMVVIHTAYAMIKMPGPKGVITIKAACENASLSYVGCFEEKAAQEQAAKAAKVKGGSMPSKTSASKPPIGNSPRLLPSSKGTNIALGSTPALVDQKADNKLKGTMETKDKQVIVDPSNPDKKLWISDNLDPK